MVRPNEQADTLASRGSIATGLSSAEIAVRWLLNVPATIIILIIIAFKGAVREFLQSPHSAANCLQHVRSSGSGAVVCKSRATHGALITCKCHVTCHLVRRDSSAIKFYRVEIAFILALYYWLNQQSNHDTSLGDRSAQIIIRAATPRQKLQIQLSISPSHSILTPGAGITEADADDRQVTTVFTVQPSFHHRHPTNRVQCIKKRYHRRRTTR